VQSGTIEILSITQNAGEAGFYTPSTSGLRNVNNCFSFVLFACVAYHGTCTRLL